MKHRYHQNTQGGKISWKNGVHPCRRVRAAVLEACGNLFTCSLYVGFAVNLSPIWSRSVSASSSSTGRGAMWQQHATFHWGRPAGHSLLSHLPEQTVKETRTNTRPDGQESTRGHRGRARTCSDGRRVQSETQHTAETIKRTAGSDPASDPASARLWQHFKAATYLTWLCGGLAIRQLL